MCTRRPRLLCNKRLSDVQFSSQGTPGTHDAAVSHVREVRQRWTRQPLQPAPAGLCVFHCIS